jgi:hypothetical protein
MLDSNVLPARLEFTDSCRLLEWSKKQVESREMERILAENMRGCDAACKVRDKREEERRRTLRESAADK